MANDAQTGQEHLPRAAGTEAAPGAQAVPKSTPAPNLNIANLPQPAGTAANIGSLHGAPLDALQSPPVIVLDFNTVLRDHQQVLPSTCIPSAVEMVLKYYRNRQMNDYRLQYAWVDSEPKSFGFFNNTVFDQTDGLMDQFFQTTSIKFHHTGHLQPNSMRDLLTNELRAGRFVIISLRNPNDANFHIWIVNEVRPNGDFGAYSKTYGQTGVLHWIDFMGHVEAMGGTDALTYTVGVKMSALPASA